MAKAARPGHVKTRLGELLSPDSIADLYKCLIEDTVQLARSVTTDALAIVCPCSDISALSHWLPEIEIVAQQGKGLAAGLVSAFRVFSSRGYRHVVALDGDSPQIMSQTLEQAFGFLDSTDVVVGPTSDGGYYLVGANALRAELFDQNRLGTSGALESLLATAQTLNLKVALTETAYDVDDPSDLARLAEELDLFPSRAPRTARWLAQRKMRG
jgi:rSAM/selenodomain-associated transferase 1